MPKIFDNLEHRGPRLNEDVWFKVNQPMLLWMANNSEGRKLLRLNQTNLGEIHGIGKNFVRYHRYVREGLWRPKYRRVSTTDFRPGAEWANSIRREWAWFEELAAEYYARFGEAHLRAKMPKWQWAFEVPALASLDFTVTTFFPDVDTETTSVDGIVGRASVDESFAAIRAGAGTIAADDGPNLAAFLTASATSNQYAAMRRTIALFDTSSIPDTDSISAAVLSAWGYQALDTTLGTPALHVGASTPASNTLLATTDYGQCGSTSFGNIANASWNAAGYNDITLDAGGIAAVDVTGISKYCLRLSWDMLNDTTGLTWVSGGFTDFAYRGADFGSNKPKLTVTHSAAAVFVSRFNIIF